MNTDCQQCGAVVEEGDRFCRNCGHDLRSDASSTATTDSLGSQQRRGRPWFIALAVVSVVAVAAAVLIAASGSGAGRQKNASQATTTTVPASYALAQLDASLSVLDDKLSATSNGDTAALNANDYAGARSALAGAVDPLEVFLRQMNGIDFPASAHEDVRNLVVATSALQSAYTDTATDPVDARLDAHINSIKSALATFTRAVALLRNTLHPGSV